MCSTLSMPADYEMLVSHSPPVFSHSPPGYLTEYASYRYPYAPYGRNVTQNTIRTSPLSSLTIPNSTEEPSTPPPNSPRRPCLVIKAEETTEYSSDPISPTKLKKRVVFADDRGMSLTHVRVMSEPSSAPPLWTTKFLAQVTKGLSAEVSPEPWEVTFAQPASDYVDFRRRLEQDKVSLENVIVRETEECVVGTVKVRNLAFHKEVIIRSSADDWITHEDTFCKFVDNNPSMNACNNGHYVLYDTFSFRLILPPRSRKIEFCVCFRCGEQEYWDNNTGKNYILLKKVPEMPKQNTTDDIIDNTKLPRSNSDTNELIMKLKCADALYAKVESWSEFASWNHLENDAPYW